MGFLAMRDGSIEVKGENKPQLNELVKLAKESELMFELGSAFKKPDYFVPFPLAEGLASSQELSSKGI